MTNCSRPILPRHQSVIRAPLRSSRRSLPSIPTQEDDRPWEPPSPSSLPSLPPPISIFLPSTGSLPSRATRRGPHHSYFTCVLDIAYIIVSLLTRPKCATAKIHEINEQIGTIPCQTQNATHPAKHGTERAQTEMAMLGFRTEQHQLTA